MVSWHFVPPIQLDYETSEILNCAACLGITVNSFCSFENHVNEIVSGA